MGAPWFTEEKNQNPLFLLILLSRKSMPCVDRISDRAESKLSELMDFGEYVECVWVQSSFVKISVEWLFMGMEKT